MHLVDLITAANKQGASDIHLEAGLPPAVRISGSLKAAGNPLSSKMLEVFARDLLDDAQWACFQEKRSYDLSRTLQGVRCRINLLHSARGIGFAIRLLSSFQATIEKLNLHPDLKRFLDHQNGLILVCGPTGCGKSSTMAALIQEINLRESRHVVTIESPIEYAFQPRHAFIRQREVGRDTPSFEQALIDAMREDPDVLMVGEMREPATMRLTLNASETGHLVLSTVHSSSCIEALQRIISAFPPETQTAVSAQLADCLVAVIAQKLRYRSDLNLRIPECEILVPNLPAKHHIRNQEFHKIATVMETGAEHGMWTWHRYRNWMEKRTQWYIPSEHQEQPDEDPTPSAAPAAPMESVLQELTIRAPKHHQSTPAKSRSSVRAIEIIPAEGGLDEVIKRLS